MSSMASSERNIFIALIIVVIVFLTIIYTFPPPMTIDNRLGCDNDNDGDCDRNDYDSMMSTVGQCIRDNRYNELADANHDGCVTLSDIEQLFPIPPER